MRIKSFNSFNEKMEYSDAQGQYELTQKAYTFLHEKGEEFEGEGDQFEKVWDHLNMFEIVKILDGVRLVSSDILRSSLDKNYGNIPRYIGKRLHDEFEHLEGSWHTYDTWDSYSLYVPKNKPESLIAIMSINRRGGGTEYRLVNYKKVMIVTHEVTKYL